MNSLIDNGNTNSETGTPKKSENCESSVQVVGKNCVEGSRPRKSLRPSKKKFMDKCAALRIIARYESVDINTLTDKEKESLEWARSINIGAKATSSSNANEIDASGEYEYVAKKQKITINSDKVVTVNGNGKKELAILDKSDEDGCIPQEQWKWVEAALAAVFFEVLEKFPGSPPLCEDAGWHQNEIKLITCEDERSTTLYKMAVNTIGEVYPGAKLVAVDKTEIPPKPRARVLIPFTPSDPCSILRMLRLCNPHLPTHNWEIEKLEEPVGAMRQAVVVVNAKTLVMLEESSGVINYGFNKVTMQKYIKDKQIPKDLSAPFHDPIVIKEEAMEADKIENISKSFIETTIENYAIEEIQGFTAIKKIKAK